MAYSGTISQTNFDTRRVIENAARRCKLPAQSLTSEHVDIAKDQLYLLLSDLSNRGIQLWCVQKSVYPLYAGNPQIVTYEGTVDILNSNLRQLQQVTGVNYDTASAREVFFSTPTMVNVVGVKWSAASVPLALQRSDDGVTWTTIQTEAPSASAGEWTWFDLSVSVAAPYFRVQAASGSLLYERIYLGNMPSEIPLARISRDDYTNLPNKSFQSNRPLQFWLDRQAQSPVLNLWPVPDASAEVQQVVVWAQRHIMDVGSLTQEIEVPQRWYDAIVALLAAKLALEYVEVDPSLIPLLDGKAKEALYFAQQEERDNSPMMILPNIAMYTR